MSAAPVMASASSDNQKLVDKPNASVAVRVSANATSDAYFGAHSYPSPCSLQSAACRSKCFPELTARALSILRLDDNLSLELTLQPRANRFVVANLTQGTPDVSL